MNTCFVCLLGRQGEGSRLPENVELFGLLVRGRIEEVPYLVGKLDVQEMDSAGKGLERVFPLLVDRPTGSFQLFQSTG